MSPAPPKKARHALSLQILHSVLCTPFKNDRSEACEGINPTIVGDDAYIVPRICDGTTKTLKILSSSLYQEVNPI